MPIFGNYRAGTAVELFGVAGRELSDSKSGKVEEPELDADFENYIAEGAAGIFLVTRSEIPGEKYEMRQTVRAGKLRL